MDAEIVVDAKAELGEGPSWDGNKGVLYWVNIPRGLVHIYEPKGHNIDRTVNAGKNVSCVVPIDSLKVAITRDHGFYSLELDTVKLTEIGRVKENLQDGTRFNDGKCDTKRQILGRHYGYQRVSAERCTLLPIERQPSEKDSIRGYNIKRSRLEP